MAYKSLCETTGSAFVIRLYEHSQYYSLYSLFASERNNSNFLVEVMDLANGLSVRLDEKKQTAQKDDGDVQEAPQDPQTSDTPGSGTLSGEFPTGAVTERELEADEV